jgi:voltage-gated potassium channel
VVMNDSARRPGPGDRLAAYQARTRGGLDLLALLTLWIVVVPPWDLGAGHDVIVLAWTLRIAISAVYGIDLAIRGVLARRPVRYALSHPVALASVAYPPVRVIFSLRLLRSVFQRGMLGRFLVAAAVLVLNGAVIVYLFERHAPHSNIHTLGDSVWWAFVTVTTVGYGDFYPVTTQGRITAIFIMVTGLVTLAVVTAQIASSFVSQGPSQARRGQQADAAPAETQTEAAVPETQTEAAVPETQTEAAVPETQTEAAVPEVTLAELDRRLARIEELLTVSASSSPRAAQPPERTSGSE